MKRQFTIFYSWQSDIDENKTIRVCLRNAIKSIQQKHKKQIQLDIKIDTATTNRSGAIDIANSIFDKISACDIFIGDLTLINNTRVNRIFNKRRMPNPNTIMELGYAVKTIGWERIICICNTKFGSLELLPFDIRKQRVSDYSSAEKMYEKNLTETLVVAIKSMIDDYDNIVKRHQETGFKAHDKAIFEKIDKICNQTLLHDSLSTAVNSLYSNEFYFRKWEELVSFYRESINSFLDKDTDQTFRIFLSHLDAFHTKCSTYFFPEKNNYKPSRMDYEEAGTPITEEMEFELLINDIFKAHKDPYQSETYPQADDRIHKLQDELVELARNVTAAYHEFILVIKKNSLI